MSGRARAGCTRLAAGLLVLSTTAPAAAAPPSKRPPAAEQKGSPSPAWARELQRLLDLSTKTLEQQAQQIAAQQKLIAEQQALLAEQARRLEEQAKRIEELSKGQELMSLRLAAVEAGEAKPDVARELTERMARLESSVREPPELPPEVVSAGDFPGSIRVPGSAAAMKFGGVVRASVVSTLDALGSDDRFLTYSIPVEGSEEAGKGKRLSLWAGATRLNFDVRTPTAVGQIRAFVEADFAGEGGNFRLRHAYGQLGDFLVGQTWSTFSDPDADHEDIDFEGVNAENVQRQAQVRWTRPLDGGARLAVAMEYPTASISGGEAVNQFPDLVGRLVWPLPREGHLQAAVVVRQVRGELDGRPHVVESAPAWGISASGVVPVPQWSEKDRFLFQVNAGQGISRYINDLEAAGGQDAIFTPLGELIPLRAWGVYADFEHSWGGGDLWGLAFNDLRSSFIWGHVEVDNVNEQPDDAYHFTDRLSLNVVWSPVPRVDLGTEFLWGRRENKDGSSGTARQFQLRMRFIL